MNLLTTYLAAYGNPCTLPGSGKNSFFGFPHWWKYLEGREDSLGKCLPKVDGLNDAWPIILAIADILIMLAGMIAVILIVVAGISYVTSQGEPDKVAQARQRILSALIGLGIIIIASVTVGFIGRTLF